MFGINKMVINGLIAALPKEQVKEYLTENIDVIIQDFLTKESEKIELEEETNQIALFLFMQGGKAYILLSELDLDFNIVKKHGVYDIKEEVKNIDINKLIEKIN